MVISGATSVDQARFHAVAQTRREIRPVGRQIGRDPEADDGGDILGSAAPPLFLPAATQQRRERQPVADIERAGALRPAHLVRRQGHQIDVQRCDIDGSAARRLRRVAVQQAAMGMNDPCCLGDRLDHPGLVIGQHDRDQGGLADPGQYAVEPAQIDQSVAVDRNHKRVGGGGADRGMLDGGHDLPPAGAPQDGRVGLGCAGGEEDFARFRADQRSDAGARLLDARARVGPAGGRTMRWSDPPGCRSWRRGRRA